MRALAEALPTDGHSNDDDDESSSVVNLDKVNNNKQLVHLIYCVAFTAIMSPQKKRIANFE